MLTTLNLGSNRIESDGTQYLADVLRSNQVLASLDVKSNKIGSDGARLLADAMRHNQVPARPSSITLAPLSSIDVDNAGSHCERYRC